MTTAYSEQEAAIIALQERIRTCRLCEEHGYIPVARPLVGGRASDRVMVIGQAPGHRSVAKGRSFSGPGGTILQKWLEQAGFPPGYLHKHTYLSSLTRCDPGVIREEMETDAHLHKRWLCADHFWRQSYNCYAQRWFC